MKHPGERPTSWEDASDDDEDELLLHEYIPPAARRNGASVLVIPGGGYKFVSIDKEGEAVGKQLCAWGFAAFILEYSLEPQRFDGRAAGVEPPIAEGIVALRRVRQRAAELQLDADRLGMLGFSAGAHLTMCICRCLEEEDFEELCEEEDRLPRAVVLAYPPARNPLCLCITGAVYLPEALDHCMPWNCCLPCGPVELCRQHRWCDLETAAAATPTALLVASEDDELLPPAKHSDLIRDALQDNSVQVQYICEPLGAHGFALEGWEERCEAWLLQHLCSGA